MYVSRAKKRKEKEKVVGNCVGKVGADNIEQTEK